MNNLIQPYRAPADTTNTHIPAEPDQNEKNAQIAELIKFKAELFQSIVLETHNRLHRSIE